MTVAISTQTVTAQTYRDLLASIEPKPDEVTRQSIPWQTDLWEARRVALQERKPIFAWMMNGSVLGCT